MLFLSKLVCGILIQASLNTKVHPKVICQLEIWHAKQNQNDSLLLAHTNTYKLTVHKIYIIGTNWNFSGLHIPDHLMFRLYDAIHTSTVFPNLQFIIGDRELTFMTIWHSTYCVGTP